MILLTLSDYAQQLPNNDCKIIKLKQSLGNARFLTQLSQDLSIGLNPECPAKECIDINVKLIPLLSTTLAELYEWKDTALEHVPIKLQIPGYSSVFLAWTQSVQCSTTYKTIQELCDIWVKVEVQNYMDILPKYNNILKGPEFVTVKFLPQANQLYFYKM